MKKGAANVPETGTADELSRASLPACVGAKKVFTSLDYYVWWTIARWLRKKHRISLKRLVPRYRQRRSGRRGVRWSDGGVTLFETASVRVEQYKLGGMHEPYFG